MQREHNVVFDQEKEDTEVCFPEYSSFHLGGEVYLRVEREEITLKTGAVEMTVFPIDSLSATGVRIGRYRRGSSLPVTKQVCVV